MNLNQYAQLSPGAFVLAHGIKNENGANVEFRDHKFLVEPYNDMSPEQVQIKCSQIGGSVKDIIKALWLAKHKQANVIYTMPSKSIVKDFVTPKVDPIIKNNPIFKSWVGQTDSIALKSIGDRFVYFRGSWEESAAISISAHILINDELDRSNQKVVRTYKTRLDAAKLDRPDLGWVWQFSNPSIPGYGVDVAWQKSNQRHWFVKCRYCGFDWYLSWPESVNMETKQYICTKCHEVLSDEDRRNGRWVVKYEDRSISGYWINQMMCRWIPASKVIEDSLGDQQIFYNFTLGLPYISQDQSVSRSTVTSCISPDTNPMDHVAMGIDNGVVKTVVIGNAYGIFKIYETESWEVIEEDIKKYNAHFVIDANPYPRTPIELTNKYSGKGYIHYFVRDQKSAEIIKWGEREKSNIVESDRTKIIDLVVGELINKGVTYNLTLTQLEQYISDWTQLYREIKVNNQGIANPIWSTIEGRRDHFAFATIYWRIALERTMTMSGVSRTPAKRSKMQEGIVISPDNTTPAVDVKKLLEKVSKGHKNWKTR